MWTYHSEATDQTRRKVKKKTKPRRMKEKITGIKLKIRENDL